jgi:hypothetical protein
MRIALGMVAILGLLLAQNAQGAPLRAKDVAAGAKWVVHVDFDAMRDSKLGAEFREKCLAAEDAQKKLKKFQEDTGVDLTKDMHSVTLYDTRFVEHSGVAIFRAAHIDKKKLVAKLKEKHPDHSTEKHGDVSISTWTEAKGKKHEHQVSGAFFGADALLFSRDLQQLKAALDVLSGKTDALSTESPLAEEAPKGTFFLVRGVGMDKDKTPFKAAVIRKSKQLSYAFGQDGNTVFAQGMLKAPSADAADKVRDVVEGFRALMQLRFGERDKKSEMLRGLKLAVAGSTIVMEWEASGDDVAKLMAEHHDKLRKWREHHKSHRDGPATKDEQKKGTDKKSAQDDDDED